MLNNSPTMEDLDGGMASEVDREEEEAVTDLLRDRFRLCTISIAEAEGRFSAFLLEIHVFRIVHFAMRSLTFV